MRVVFKVQVSSSVVVCEFARASHQSSRQLTRASVMKRRNVLAKELILNAHCIVPPSMSQYSLFVCHILCCIIGVCVCRHNCIAFV
eukprot:8069-Heterococcus_DN1.PRE.1